MNRVDGSATVATRTATTFVITEHEIAFATAAAMPLRPKTIHWWSEVSGVALAAVRRLFAESTPDRRQPPTHYPKHYQFLESSCLARAMDRL